MRALLRVVPLLALATTLSCSDMPTAPKEIITVSGQITDRDGPGIGQAYIYFYSLDPRDIPPNPPVIIAAPRSTTVDAGTVTDGNGRFTLQIPAGPYRVVIQPQSGYPQAVISRFEPKPGHAEFNYRYTGVRVTGNVSGPEGAVLQNIQVGAHRWVPGVGTIEAYSSPIGSTYSLLIPPGTYELGATAIATFGIPIVEKTVTVSQDTTIDLAIDGLAVSGTVTGQNGLPLDRFRIEASTGPGGSIVTFSKPDGTYLMYVPAGVYQFRVRHWDYEDGYIASRSFQPVPVNASAVVNFDLSGVEWTGTVRNAADSVAVANIWVSAAELESDFGADGASCITDATGHFRLILARNTYYSVTVSGPQGYQRLGAFAASVDTTADLYVNLPLP